MQHEPYNLDGENPVENTNKQEGQKIYIYDLEGHEVIKPVYGYICPRVRETLSIFDNKSGLYYHYEVMRVTHGTNIASHKLVTTIQVKHTGTDK